MVSVEWGRGPREARIRAELDALLDRIDAEAREDGMPQAVQVTVEGAGTLGIVVGAEWSVRNQVPGGVLRRRRSLHRDAAAEQDQP